MGVILGTAAYMSPEQAKGRTVDRRTDVWVFGCVLYEMLTGQRAFHGEDVSDTLAAVLRAEPDWTLLPPDVPAPVRSVLQRCLEKDRRKRIPDISVAQFLMHEEPAVATPVVASAPVVLPRAPRKAIAIAATLALVLGAGVATLVMWLVTRSAPPPPVRFAIVPPAAQPLSIQGFQRDIAITPDGRHIVYRTGVVGQSTGGPLVVRSLDQLDVRVLAGISGRSTFVSPDGHWLGFFADGGKLKKVSITGGPPITLCRYSGQPLEASWGSDDTIIFATTDTATGLLTVPAGGGEPKVLTTPDTAQGEADHAFPFILPGGRAVLFTITPQGQPIENAQIAMLDLKTGRARR